MSCRRETVAGLSSCVAYNSVHCVRRRLPRQIVFLAHRRGRGFPMVVFDPEVWSAIDLAALTSRFVTVRGTVTLYRDRPQIVVTDPAQVAFP